jgi:hypothetical protein
MRRLIIGLAALLGAAGCSSTTAADAPPPVPTSQLHFVVQDSLSPPLYTDTASRLFAAGQSGDFRIYYKDPTSGSRGEEFVRFEVPGDGLFRKPDGSAFQPGDTVRISIRVVDAARFVFDFQPSGLQFNPNDPARFKVEYVHANHDYNDDGVVDAADSTIQQQLDIWKNDPPSTMWFKRGSVNFESLEELDANILSFSQYAVAW